MSMPSRTPTPSFWDTPYGSYRHPLAARRIISTTHPLAAQAGLRMFDRGGNAVDAALAAAIALTVVEPVSNGLGSDMFALLADGREFHTLNASGKSPRRWTEAVTGKWTAVPARGWNSVTVPGAVAGWLDLSSRFGKLEYEALFEPAIEYAERGFMVSAGLATRWEVQVAELASQPGFAQAFMPAGRAPRPGELFRLDGLANSLRKIAETRNEAFYRGDLAQRMAADAERHGALLTQEDLATHENIWGKPLSIDFNGYQVLQAPPNGQGLAVLIALGILDRLNITAFAPDSSAAMHLQLEALKLAFADVQRYVCDPATMEFAADLLLSDAYLSERSRAVDMRHAKLPEFGTPTKGGTVHVAAADDQGGCISLIQSNFMGFGSGVVVPGTGISFQNRGSGFVLEKGHPNQIGPGKRSLHTILPGMVAHQGLPMMALGVTGGNMQPQGQVQLLNRMLGAGQNPQTAIDAPRFRITQGLSLNLEGQVSAQVAAELSELGHRIEPLPPGYMDFGCAQVVSRLGDHWIGGADARKDGTVVGY
jgi:gamma-glutamyltranspeptidase/glutathione hydrolase